MSSSDPRSDEAEKGAYAHLEQSLVAPEEELPTTSATPMIEVVAPATLPEGYKFDAQVGNHTIQVTVPLGGIEGGQKFMVPLPDGSVTNDMMVPKINIPVGHWKDGLCDCFTYGPFHNHCLMACCCPLSQVISRLKLSVWGKPGNVSASTGAFHKIVTMTLGYFALITIFNIICSPYDNEPYPQPSAFIFILMVVRGALHYVYLGVLIYIMWNVRYYVRQKYAIPESETCQTGCEDLLCAVFCAHCTAAQMLRHTTDYDTYNATCCTETGVPPHVPSIV